MNTKHLTCPQCGQPVELQQRYCSNCQVDLALAAVWAEEQLGSPDQLPVGLPVTPEILVPRLGEYLVEKGYITEQQLALALAHQADSIDMGHRIVIGQALRELNFVSPEILNEVVTVQILELQGALRRANHELEVRVQERTRDLERAVEKLKELSQHKANFIANISHELRTPLTHIKGYLELFASGELGELTATQSQAVKVMVRAEERLQRLIEDLIQFSMVTRGKLALHRTRVSIGEIFQVVVHQARPKARPSNVSIDLEIESDLPEVLCDEEKIAWVISQLVDNAIKFSPAAGKVLIRAWIDGESVKISVSDTGIGIPEDKLAEIFEPFYQLDSSSTRRYGGAGLGLALSQRILAAHGSQIKIESSPGTGSTFEFALAIDTIDEGDPDNV